MFGYNKYKPSDALKNIAQSDLSNINKQIEKVEYSIKNTPQNMRK